MQHYKIKRNVFILYNTTRLCIMFSYLQHYKIMHNVLILHYYRHILQNKLDSI